MNKMPWIFINVALIIIGWCHVLFKSYQRLLTGLTGLSTMSCSILSYGSHGRYHRFDRVLKLFLDT